MFSNYFYNLTLKALIITTTDSKFFNNFLHFGYKKTEQNQMKFIESLNTILLIVSTF